MAVQRGPRNPARPRSRCAHRHLRARNALVGVAHRRRSEHRRSDQLGPAPRRPGSRGFKWTRLDTLLARPSLVNGGPISTRPTPDHERCSRGHGERWSGHPARSPSAPVPSGPGTAALLVPSASDGRIGGRRSSGNWHHRCIGEDRGSRRGRSPRRRTDRGLRSGACNQPSPLGWGAQQTPPPTDPDRNQRHPLRCGPRLEHVRPCSDSARPGVGSDPRCAP